VKVTKKMRKKAEGMNAITRKNYGEGFKPEKFHNIAEFGDAVNYVNHTKGTPYVNPNNFNLL
tara:strand:+ start:690 stop:875 length:186 start_codon:yes stop_codon:yes gene_type:complete